MTALLVIVGSLFAAGCLVGIVFYWSDLTEERQRIPSDQDWEPDLDRSQPDRIKNNNPAELDL